MEAPDSNIQKLRHAASFWLIWLSLLISAVFPSWQSEYILYDMDAASVPGVLVSFGTSLLVASVASLLVSYFLFRIWLSRPASFRVWSWFVALAVMAGLAVSCFGLAFAYRDATEVNLVRTLWDSLVWTVLVFGGLLLFHALWHFMVWLHSPKTFVSPTVRPLPRERVRLWNGLLVWSIIVGAVLVAWKENVNYYYWHSNSGRAQIVRLEIIFVFVAVGAYVALYQALRVWRGLPANRKAWIWIGILSIVLGTLWTGLLVWDSAAQGKHYSPGQVLWLFIISLLALLVFWLWLHSLRKFFHWLFSWRILKRCLLTLAALVILALIFRTEEDWRGKYAWKKYRQEFVAKGGKLDFRDCIPPPLPDDENFAMAPVVATTYEWALDKSGRRLVPFKTNVINRLRITLYRTNNWSPDGLKIGSRMQMRMTDLKPWQDYYRATTFTNGVGNISMLPAGDFPTALQPQTPAEDVLLALSRYDGVLAELQQACERPFSRFPLDYETARPFNLMLPHLNSLKDSAQVLQLRAIANSQAGKMDDALRDVKMMLRLVQSVRTEPELISHFVQGVMIETAIQPVWEGLVERRWSDTQLQALGEELQKLDFVLDARLALQGEQAQLLGIIDYADTNRNLVVGFYGMARYFDVIGGLSAYLPKPPEIIVRMIVEAAQSRTGQFCLITLNRLPPSGWYAQNKITVVKICGDGYFLAVNPEKHLLSQQAVATAEKKLNDVLEGKNISPNNILVHSVMPSFSSAIHKFAAAQSAVDMARVACALERYRLANDNYPEELSTLAPRFIEMIPIDVVNGQPLHYRCVPDAKFLLYSEGWNGRDDGGIIATNQSGRYMPHQGDWVWKYPAK